MRLQFVCAALFLGCSSDANPVAANDAEAMLPTHDGGCDPDCHWDCFGSPPTCSAGVVWSMGRGPRTCCHYGDPWPDPGPVCSTGSIGTCRKGCATLKEADARYTQCAHGRSMWSVLCRESGPKAVGAPCASDVDCRPAAEGVAGLRCDAMLRTCVAAERPPTPSNYGAPCTGGIDPAINNEFVTDSTDKGLCYAARDAVCARSFTTQSCQFDEDCPVDSICVCTEFNSSSFPPPSICLPRHDRTKVGRLSVVPCASPADAGADG